MAEAAARTGARMLVIAIAGRNGWVIRELTDAAERCGLAPKVIPSAGELLTGGARIEGCVTRASATCSDARRRRPTWPHQFPSRKLLSGFYRWCPRVR